MAHFLILSISEVIVSSSLMAEKSAMKPGWEEERDEVGCRIPAGVGSVLTLEEEEEERTVEDVEEEDATG